MENHEDKNKDIYCCFLSNSHYFPLMCIKMTCMFQICCQGRDNENVNELHVMKLFLEINTLKLVNVLTSHLLERKLFALRC